MEEKTSAKKPYIKPVVKSKLIELPVMACACSSGGGSFQSFIALATNSWAGHEH
jgi:hypothetical protein